MNFDSKTFRGFETAALETAGQKKINSIYLFVYFRKTCTEWKIVRKFGSDNVCFMLGIVLLDLL
jgi:hypothetical protein